MDLSSSRCYVPAILRTDHIANGPSHRCSMSSAVPGLSPAQVKKRKCEAGDKGDEAVLQSSPSANGRLASAPSSPKRPRIIGPTLPPASLDEQPSQPPDGEPESSSGGDDDFGPSLPTETSPKPVGSSSEPLRDSATGPQAPATATAKNQRDEWMIVPPSSGDWSARVDPTKLKSRKFNSGKGAKGAGQTPGKDSNANWTETPDEKRLRLHREIMGIKNTSTSENFPEDDTKARENARKLHEFTVSVVAQLSPPVQD